jgi:peroxiredoxin
MRIFLLLLTVMLTGALDAQTPAKKIPPFTFYQLNNTAFASTSLPKGKKILFVFFDTGCEHCQRSVARYNQHMAELRNTAVYFVTLDVKAKIDPFMDKYGSNIRKEKNVLILQDRQFQFITRFQPKKYPSMFLYSSQQQLIFYSDDETAVDTILQLVKAKAG